MVNYNVPFFENTPDNTHCFQATLKMVLKYFLPDEDYTFAELEKITDKVEGKWTWRMAGLIWMKERGFEVKDIEFFNYKEFHERGEAYHSDFYGKEITEAQIAHGDLPKEAKLAKVFVEKINPELCIPETREILEFLDEGFLVICNVNSKALNNKDGYSGHFVVVKGYNEDSFVLHDPGRPGVENRIVSFADFDKAWSYPDERAKNIMAFRL